MEAREIRRHGDLLIKRHAGFSIPSDVQLAPVTVLHKGNNHDHFFSSGKALVGEAGGKKYLRIVEDAIISHGRGGSSEHADKPVPMGDHWVEIQTEYDHLSEESRAVID